MGSPILNLKNISLTLGGTNLLENVELSLLRGDRLCLIGRNGSGKSTLLKIAAGLAEPDQGERFLQPGMTLHYLAQEPDLSGSSTILDYTKSNLKSDDDVFRVKNFLQQVGLTGDENPSQLSGGEAQRAALVRALATTPDILLLDEPTNHLDLPTIEWLESQLLGSQVTLIIVSHDRRFLENLSQITVWLEGGITRRLGNSFSAFENWRDEIIEQNEQDRHELDRKIKSETTWLRQGVKARRKRNQGRLRALYSLREERREQRAQQGQVAMTATTSELSGKLVIEAKNISKSFGKKLVLKNFSLRVRRGERIGIVGANGAGKTTLLNILTGVMTPDEGSVRLGTNLNLVTLDQRRENLDPKSSLSKAIGGGNVSVSVQGRPRHVVSYMKDYLFTPEQANTPVEVLSGGERSRLMLARALAKPSNLLVLDEPTNDLDLETLDLLQEMLSDYKGTVLIVSHDRDFIDRTVTSIVAFEGNGKWTEYPGGYSDNILSQNTTFEEQEARNHKRKRTKPLENQVRKSKLSYKEIHALKKLPEKISVLQTQILNYQTTLEDPDLFRSNLKLFESTVAVLKAAQTDLAAAEEEWLRLELRREELEST